MNLYLAWSKPLGDSFRPVGTLFYRIVFAGAGFDPRPFRMICLAIGLGNIALSFWFARLISGSARAAALTSLLFAFHPRLIEVWYRTAVIYDLLCFTFFYLAACLYVESRKRGQVPGPARTMSIVLCYLLALGSKEMAVTLPLILLAYELLFQRPQKKSFWFLGALALVNIPYAAYKLTGPNAMVTNPAYLPDYSFSRFAHSWAAYVGDLLVRPMAATTALAILAAMLFVAAGLRSRTLIYSWILLFTTLFPVCFVPVRAGFVIYLSWLGWTLYAALILVSLQDRLNSVWPQYRMGVACAVFVLTGWRFGKISLHDQRIDSRHWLYDEPGTDTGHSGPVARPESETSAWSEGIVRAGSLYDERVDPLLHREAPLPG